MVVSRTATSRDQTPNPRPYVDATTSDSALSNYAFVTGGFWLHCNGRVILDAVGLFLKVEPVLRWVPADAATGRNAHIALLPPELQEAIQEFGRQATDADLHANIARWSAIGDVLLTLQIVVCHTQQKQPAADDSGLLRRITHAVDRLFVRAA